MQQIVIEQGQAGQRFDKFLRKYFPEASGSFLYKMLRKKNITLNGKRADGSEKLAAADQVTFFFAEETYQKFRGLEEGQEESGSELAGEGSAAYERFGALPVLYEDEHVLLVNKPAGILSQKASPKDLSLNEWLIGYLLAEKAMTEKQLSLFHPSVCNRLDRNTSGIVICGKSLYGSQQMSRILKDRSLHKYYLLYVVGALVQGSRIEGYLYKEERTNQVTILEQPLPGSTRIATAYSPLVTGTAESLVEVELITGKTHQIRAHLASIGFPLVGDPKYGNPKANERYQKQYGIRHQLLHAHRVVFPRLEGALESLSEREILAPPPPIFKKLEKER